MSTPAASPQEPFLGLRPFGEHEADYFFGRDRETAELRRRVEREVVTVFFGKSGLGKTSLLRAGLFPLLRRERFLPVPVRLDFSHAERDVAAQITTAVSDAAREAGVEAPAAESDETLWEYFHRTSFWNATNHLVTPLVVVDQFEEIFTLGRGYDGLEAFLSELADWLENRIPKQVRERLERDDDELGFAFEKQRFRVVVCLREDFLPELEELRRELPSLGRNRLRLTHLDGVQALEAVLEPGREIITPEVAEQVVRFVAGARRESALGAETADAPLARLEIEPALLSLVAHELNRRRLEQGSPKISTDLLSGRRREILEGFYERCLAGRPAALRRLVEDRLLTGSGFRSTLAVDDALRESGVVRADLEALVERRLLRREERLGIPHLELVHDVLTDVVRASRDRRRQRELQQRRNRRLATLASGLVLIAAIALGFAWFSARARDEAQAQERVLARRLAELHAEQGRQELLQGRWQQALVFLSEAAATLEGDPALRVLLVRATEPLEAEIAVLEQGAAAQPLGTAEAGERPAEPPAVEAVTRAIAADLSADGTRIAVAGESGAAVWRLSDGGNLVRLETPAAELRALRFDPAGQRLAGIAATGELVVWQADDGRKLASTPPTAARALAWHADGSKLATAGDDRAARVWDAGSGELLATFELRSYPLDSVALDPLRPRALAGGKNTAVLWNSETGAYQLGLDIALGSTVGTVLFDPTGELLLTAGWPPAARLWQASTGELVGSLEGHTDTVVDADFSGDGALILTAAKDGTAKLWDARGAKLLASYELGAQTPVRARFGPSAESFTLVQTDGVLRRWNLVPRYSSAGELARLIGCYVPWKLAAGRLLPVEPDSLPCRRQFEVLSNATQSGDPK